MATDKIYSRLEWHQAESESVSWLSQVHAIHNCRDAIHFLEMTLRELGKEIARIEGRPQPYHKATVERWTLAANRKRHWEMNNSQVDAVGILIANKVDSLAKRAYPGVKIEHNSPWRVTVWSKCYCGRWYEMRRTTDVGCQYHRKRRS